jgi:hypothetical protein
MWRAFFLAIGITLCILGAECLVVEKAVLASPNSPPPTASSPFQPAPTTSQRPREIVPPEWAAWSLLSAGAVVILYSFTIPKRVAG